MEKKSLIIGAMTNYDFDKVAPWIKSVNECGFEGDKTMIVFNASFDTVQKISDSGFSVVVFDQDDESQMFRHETPAPIHIERFFHIYNYLKDTWQDYDYVVTTDVKDVIFQKNPIDWLKENLGDKKLVAGSEALKYKDESWGDENLMQTYGPYVYEIFKENEIYNVGTLGGTAEYMKDLAFNIFFNSVSRPIRIVDQAVFNVLIQTQPFKDVIKFAKQSDGWACQAGTVADPSKMDTFRPNLLEAEPQWFAGKVLTSTFKEFTIVHQYDRVPEWKEVIEAKYK
jgi:hypothetical protein